MTKNKMRFQRCLGLSVHFFRMSESVFSSEMIMQRRLATRLLLLLFGTGIVSVYYIFSTKISCGNSTVDLASSPPSTFLRENKAEISKTADLTKHFNTDIKRIFLLGERNSGTNFIERILWSAFPSYGREGAKSQADWPFVSGIPVIDFKHMWRHDLLTEEEKKELISTADDALWLLAVRNPSSWADGMYRKPYHMCPPGETDCGRDYIDLGDTSVYASRLEFMQHSWSDNIEIREYPGTPNTYTDLFDLRRHKLELMKTITELFPHQTRIINLRHFELNPHSTIEQIVHQFKLNVSETYWASPAEPSEMIHPDVCLSEEEWKFAQTHIDWDMEGHFGFTPLDCHLCLGE